MEKKFWKIRILGGCTAVDNFAQSAQQRRHGNQNMKSSLFQPNFFASTSEKCSHSTKMKINLDLSLNIIHTNEKRENLLECNDGLVGFDVQEI